MIDTPGKYVRMLGAQMIGMLNIGIQMTSEQIDEQLRTHAIELRVLLSVIFKIVHQSLEERLSKHNLEMSRFELSIFVISSH